MACWKNCPIGVISMVCMDLPANLRWKIENIYIAGIISGPCKPSTTQINHFLQPLAKDLLKLWEPQIHAHTVSMYLSGLHDQMRGHSTYL
jgi:hypothetical protein